MARVALADIHALTLYKDEITRARRTSPIPQLTCIGKPCRLFQPDVVRCENIGGSGTEVDWKCEADLPDSLRFGRVQVSCEGWDRPGDPYVLKGSCGLEYRLVQVPGSLRGPGAEDPSYPSRLSRLLEDPASAIFFLIWVAALTLIIYSVLSSCLRRRPPASSSSTPPRPPFGSGWFSGPSGPSDSTPDPPPPYTKHPSTNTNTTTRAHPNDSRGPGWLPGFMAGAAVGGLGTYLFNRPREDARARAAQAAWGPYDWEAGSAYRRPPVVVQSGPWFGSGAGAGAQRRGGWDGGDRDRDRGEGPSNLGSMRRSTGMGGSSVR